MCIQQTASKTSNKSLPVTTQLVPGYTQMQTAQQITILVPTVY